MRNSILIVYSHLVLIHKLVVLESVLVMNFWGFNLERHIDGHSCEKFETGE